MANIQKYDTEVMCQLAGKIELMASQVKKCGQTTKTIARDMDQESGGWVEMRQSTKFKLIPETLRGGRVDQSLMACADILYSYADMMTGCSKEIRQAAAMMEKTERSIKDMCCGVGEGNVDAPARKSDGSTVLKGLLSLFGPGDKALDKKNENRTTYDDLNNMATNYTETFDDDSGQFGANQGEAVQNYRRLKSDGKDTDEYADYVQQCKAIITRNGKEMPDDLEAYLAGMNAEGCGYAAMTNCVFAAFEGDPDAFEDTFGYPMYAADGTQNFDLLMLDIYSMTDCDWDIPAFGVGLKEWSLQSQLKTFCKKHHLEVETKKYSGSQINAGNYTSKVASNEMLLISVHNDFADDPNSGIYRSREKRYPIMLNHDEGHWVTITGVDSDTGMMEVSSWGENYYFDPTATGIGMDVDYVKVSVSRS